MDVSGVCSGAAGLLQFVGYILTIFKIAIPLIIIALGIFDFGKAVTAAKDDEIKKSVKSLIMRAIAGVVIFFIPSIVMMIFDAVNNYSELTENNDFNVCEACVLKPWTNDCKNAIN
jgi:amino acid transporter